MAEMTVIDAISAGFLRTQVKQALKHFEAAVGKFQQGDWEGTLQKVSKVVEAALKALAKRAGVAVATGRAFKVEAVITGLAQLPATSQDDSIRLLIPRACRFVYDIASNRGARHDPDEVDPNEMDATVAVEVSSWIVSDMIRVAQKGSVDLATATALVASLTIRRYPVVEDVDGRLYVNLRNKSGTDVALIALARRYPERLSKIELLATIKRNGFSAANASMAVKRIKQFVDDDGAGNLRVLSPGIRKAEERMATGT